MPQFLARLAFRRIRPERPQKLNRFNKEYSNGETLWPTLTPVFKNIHSLVELDSPHDLLLSFFLLLLSNHDRLDDGPLLRSQVGQIRAFLHSSPPRASPRLSSLPLQTALANVSFGHPHQSGQRKSCCELSPEDFIALPEEGRRHWVEI